MSLEDEVLWFQDSITIHEQCYKCVHYFIEPRKEPCVNCLGGQNFNMFERRSK